MKLKVIRSANQKVIPSSWETTGLSVVRAENTKGTGLVCEVDKKSLLLCFQLQGRTILGRKILRTQQFTIWRGGNTKLRCSGGSRLILIACSNRFLKRWGMRAAFFDALEEKDLFMDIHILNDLEEMIACDFEKEGKEIFILGKLLQLFSRMKSIAIRQPKRKHIRSEYDLERIQFARDYLLQNVAIPPTIPQLARISGINELKLKMGFREIFNNTVYGYLSDHRLEMAKKEMKGNKTLTEIAFELGYSSNQHFSMAFKKKFGAPPNKFR